MKKLVVEKEKLVENIHALLAEAKTTGTKVIAMLKGNGYGLGLCAFAKLLTENGIDTISVCLLEEARTLREGGIDAQILLLSPTCNLAEATEAISLGVTCAVGSEESCAILDIAAEQAGVKAKAHLAIDTGFGRFGFLYSDMQSAAKLLSSAENIEITGTFSHLSDAFGKPENSDKQFSRFTAAIDVLSKLGINPGMRHLCNSCGFLRYKNMRLDAVRIGSAFLGRLPIQSPVALKRIAYLESCICETKLLPAGFNIGYANTFKTKKETRIGVVPVGYMDGFGVSKINDTFRFSDILRYTLSSIRSLFRDNSVYVRVGGKRCRVLGRISMFNIIVDLTDTDAQAGTEVILECNPILINASVAREYK